MAASNVALSRSAPTLPNTCPTRATIRGGVSARLKNSPSLPSSSLFYTGPKPLVALRSSVNRCSAPAGPTPICATIAPGERLPDATLSYVDDDGKLRRTTTVAELTAGKKVVLLAVGNAVCVDNLFLAYQFVEMVKKLRDLGVDTVACVARLPLKDSSKVKAWQTFLEKEESGIVLLADNGKFVKALGTTQWPLRVCVEDGVVKTAGEFHGKFGGKADAVQELKDLEKLKDLLGLMISGKTAGSRPESAYKKEITSEGINENGFIDSLSGKAHIEELMKQQVKQECMSQLYELKEKFEKLVRGGKSGLDRSKIESLKKKLMIQPN